MKPDHIGQDIAGHTFDSEELETFLNTNFIPAENDPDGPLLAKRQEVGSRKYLPIRAGAGAKISGERRALAMRVEAAGSNQPATVVTAGETALTYWPHAYE